MKNLNIFLLSPFCLHFTASFNINVLVSRSEDDVARYQDGYSKLRSWTYSSLDLYKVLT